MRPDGMRWLWACFLLLLSGLLFADGASNKAPNFVVIIADDLGALDLGTFGHPVVKTPNIDQIAQQGLQFNNAFLTTSSCSASRASILTGLYPHNTGAPNLHDAVPAERKLVSSYLRDAGYYTAAIGKWHLGDNVRAQFDWVDDPPGDSGAEGWVEALAQRPKDKPFFFWFASRDPHVPYSELAQDGPYQPKDAVILPVYFDGPGARQNIAQYYTEISRLDAYVGKVVAALKAEGVFENTYIIFLSDNGASMPRAKTTLYDAGIKTPLLVRGPGIAAGAKVEALVSVLDLMPTVLKLAGVADVNTMQGQEFSRLLKQPESSHREMIFAEQHNHGFLINKQAARSQDYLYIRNIGENKINCILEVQPMGRELHQALVEKRLNKDQAYCFSNRVPPEELYAVKKDPLQLQNLAEDPSKAGIKALMKSKLAEQMP